MNSENESEELIRMSLDWNCNFNHLLRTANLEFCLSVKIELKSLFLR